MPGGILHEKYSFHHATLEIYQVVIERCVILMGGGTPYQRSIPGLRLHVDPRFHDETVNMPTRRR